MDYLMLVNKINLIKKNDLINLKLIPTKDTDIEGAELLVEEKTLYAYKSLKQFLNDKNIEIGISHGYRSLENQQAITDRYIKDYGKEYTKKIVAPVGASEHHTGLAIDINIKINNHFNYENDFAFEHLEVYKKIESCCPEFGFILRYPYGKEEITGYPYEPWHFRYVGDKKIAKEIMNKKITLEEYLGKV